MSCMPGGRATPRPPGMQEPTDLPPLSPIVDYLVAIVVKDDVLVSGTIPISDDDLRCRDPEVVAFPGLDCGVRVFGYILLHPAGAAGFLTLPVLIHKFLGRLGPSSPATRHVVSLGGRG